MQDTHKFVSNSFQPKINKNDFEGPKVGEQVSGFKL
jgi:hypothetical protein